MAKRLKEIFIRDQGDQGFMVWIDVSRRDLEDIEGVEQVLAFVGSGYKVFCDPRYDLEEIKVEIAGLVKS